jgi:uncharacterized membrane protein
MCHDNVTPFRPRPKPVQPQKSGGLGFNTHRGKAVLVQGLALAAFALNWFLPQPPLSLLGMAVGIAGAVLAYSNRGEGMPWAATHHEHALRTLIIGYSIWVLGSLLTYVSPFLALATWFTHLAVAVWAGLRASIALVLALLRRPVPNPRGAFV